MEALNGQRPRQELSDHEAEAAFGARQISRAPACVACARREDRAGDSAGAIEVGLHGVVESRARHIQARTMDAWADLRAALRFVARWPALHLLRDERTLAIRN